MKEEKSALLFVVPSIFIVLMIQLYPIFFNFYISTFDWFWYNPEMYFVGLDNYIKILTTPVFWDSLKTTLTFMVAAVSLQFLVGVGIALILNENFVGRSVVRTLFIIPMMLAPVAAGVLWRYMFIGSGVINYILRYIGIHSRPLWLSDPSIALSTIIISDSWITMPFMVIVLLAGLQSIPQEPYEAASLDGASKFQVFRHITLPMLRPAIMIALLVDISGKLKGFDLAYIITGGGPGHATELLGIYTYRTAFVAGQFGLAGAISVITIAVILLISWLLVRTITREVPLT